MRIERIELDGFGRFHQARWALEDGITVLVGANEAGKTTLLNGLRALLFGFEPTRDGRTWYPPLAGGRRGGRLLLRTAADERWTVERHGEKGGAGSLVVRAPNGNQGGQETLDRLLRGADRDLFNNIFAFGLGELQTLSSLSADGVRGRIYGAGAGLGGTNALELERRLRQQLDATFLPRGSQRPLNVLLGRMEELHREIADLARQPEEYELAHRERVELAERADLRREAIRGLRERSARLARQEAAGPIVAELDLIESELAGGDDGLDGFPNDAVAVLDRRSAELEKARAILVEIDEQLAEARAARERLEIDERILAASDEVVAVVEERATRAAADDRRADLEAAEARSAVALAEQLARVGGWEEDRLLALDDSIPALEATRAHERRLGATGAAAAEAEARRRSTAEELEMREREGGPEPGADASLESRSSALRELEALRLRTAAVEARLSVGSRSTQPAVVIAVALMLGALAGAQLDAAAIGAVAGAIAGVVVVLFRRPTGGDAGVLERLQAERRAALEALGLAPEAPDEELRTVADDLAEQRARRGLASERRAGLEARRAELRRRAAEAEAARGAAEAASASWHAWLEERGLPADLTPEAARQLLAAAGIARRAAAERDQHRARLAELVAADAAHAERADALLASLGIARPPDAARRSALVLGLGTRLERARVSRRRADELAATIEQRARRRGPAAEEVEERLTALDAHLEALGCADADEARRRAREASARRERQSRARELRERLAGVAGGVPGIEALVAEVRTTDPAKLEVLRRETEEELAATEQEEREILSRIGALEARIRQLEAADELGAKRQELAVLEGRAAATARDWAVRAIALRLLEETRSRHERERQPDVVRAAEAHFERITGGRYAAIVAPPGSGSVRVETEGGEARITEELSRGTAEQLYLALRFGLIEEFARQAEPLPVVMDDILVNFDTDRAGRAAAAIRDLAARHQVLYFTCHAATARLLDPGEDRTLMLN